MFPIEVQWQPASGNADLRSGVWVDTVSLPESSYTDGTWIHKAIIVDFEHNAINVVSLGKIRVVESFMECGDDDSPPPPPRPINLFGRRVNTGRDNEQAG